jgi:hypothetical protein
VPVPAREVLAQVPVPAREVLAQVPVPAREGLAQVPVRVLAREGVLVWVATAAGQVKALAPGLEEEEAAAAGVLPPGSPASERR